MNYNTKLNLLKLKNAFTTNIKGRLETKRCICIPIDDNYIFIGEKGAYLELSFYESQNQQFDQTHMIKVSIPKEKYEKMTDLEKQENNIIGNLKPFTSSGGTVTGTTAPENFDDLPF